MSLEDFLTFRAPPRPTLPNDFTLLLTDTLESPSTFLLTYFIARELRSEFEKRRVVLIGLGEGVEGYTSLLRKNGIQLGNEIAKGRVMFVDGASTLAFCEDGRLAALVGEVELALKEEGALVLIDDFSSLLWAGYDPQLLIDTFSYLREIIASRGGSLIVLLHGDDLSKDSEGEDGYLFRQILQRTDLWLATSVLSSQSRGELSIHRGPALIADHGIITRSGSTALQYKLEEAGAVFSVKGLGRGFL